MKVLVAVPVFNEEKYVRRVLRSILDHAGNVVVIDDGSTDNTPDIIADFPVDVIRHAVNRGYGRSIRDAFMWARAEGYEWLITMDCDEQHEPASIPEFIAAAERAGAPDIISGSRYLSDRGGDPAPADRQEINRIITGEINAKLGLSLTDSFCGFKAFRVSALERLHLTESGYAFPMQFWVQARAAGLRISEIPVRRIYVDLARSFGGPLDNPEARLAHYREIMNREIELHRAQLPAEASRGLCRRYCGA
jgi:dolichol-phosphate mannosyltransferase